MMSYDVIVVPDDVIRHNKFVTQLSSPHLLDFGDDFGRWKSQWIREMTKIAEFGQHLQEAASDQGQISLSIV